MTRITLGYYLIFGRLEEQALKLCKSLSKFRKKAVCDGDKYVKEDPLLEAYVQVADSLPLDKSPGLRPIGIGVRCFEESWVIKAIIFAIRPYILQSAGSLQLCAGLLSGCETAAHAMRDISLRNLDTCYTFGGRIKW